MYLLYIYSIDILGTDWKCFLVLKQKFYNLETINAFWSVLKMYLLYIYSIDIFGTDWKYFLVLKQIFYNYYDVI